MSFSNILEFLLGCLGSSTYIFCLMKLFLGSVVFVVNVLVFQLLVPVLALQYPFCPPKFKVRNVGAAARPQCLNRNPSGFFYVRHLRHFSRCPFPVSIR